MKNRELLKFIPNDKKEQTWIPTKEVAKRFGVDSSTIRNHKMKHPELIDGVDWINATIEIDGVNRKVLCWSLEGINKLSKIIRSNEAKEHRELTTIDPNLILQEIEKVLLKQLQPIPKLVQDVERLNREMVHPITLSKMLRRFSDKRYEVKTKLGISWQQIHDIARNPTGKSKYDHMNTEEIRDAMRRLNDFLKSYGKKN